MTRKRLRKTITVGTIALVLATLGVYNIVLKATFSLLDDGVFWKDAPEGVVAARVAASGSASRAGVRIGDILLAVDGEEMRRAADAEDALARRQDGDRVTYQLLRATEKRALEVTLRPLARGNVNLFYYLSLVGFFSLAVGTIVMLRRPTDRNTLHFYAICLLFFLLYSTSFT
ncbi:MAG TPA: PDZ domain-containing protein, partial [Vicinamibacteria bacterium]|nr:PDZ domain-containing protein [Vicinamibacteria bacterium]